MLKRCKDALAVACALTLACALSPVTALAQVGDTTTQQNKETAETSAQLADAAGNTGSQTDAQTDSQTDATVETEVDASKLQQTDVSKLADVSDTAADAVQDYIEARADEVTGEASASDDDSLDLSKKVAKTSEERADNFQQMQDDANIDITDADTTVSVSKVTESGSKVKVKAYEQTVFYYDDLADGVGGSDVAIFGTEHTVTLDTSGSDTTIKKDAYDESDLNGIDTTGSGDASAATGSASGSATGSTGAGDSSSSTSSVSPLDALASLVAPQQAYAATTYDSNYSVEKAIAYADKYWSEYNTKYRNFNPVGGDCANFVSQCLKAGKLNQKKSGKNLWYYNSGTDYSESWTYCPTMVSALKSRGKYYWISKKKLNTKAAANKIYPGSPVIYNSADDEDATGSYYHAVICTGYNSAGTPVISAHNNDRYHVPFTYAGNACATIQLTAAATGSTYTTTVSTTMSSGAVEESVFSWSPVDSTTATITGWSGSATEVSIPETVSNNGQDFQVTGISDGAFQGQTGLKTVTIPASVTSVGASAFDGCTALKTASGLDHVTAIGSYAFHGCAKLTAAALSPQLTTLETGVFQGCKKLAALTGASGVTKVGAYALDGCKKLTGVSELSQVATIGKYAFRNCKKLAALPAFALVTKVGSYAFKNCDALVKVSGFSALASLGKGAFYGCDSLKKVNVKSASLTTVGARSFWKNPSLVSASFASEQLAKIGNWAFYKDAKLKTVKLKTTLLTKKNVGFSAFTGTAAKPKVYAPASVHATYKTAFVKHGLSSKVVFVSY